MNPILLILNIIMGLCFISTVSELLTKYVGILGYILWVIVAPILSPALLFYPWFEKWVSGSSEINSNLTALWGVWVFAQISAFTYCYIKANKQS